MGFIGDKMVNNNEDKKNLWQRLREARVKTAQERTAKYKAKTEEVKQENITLAEYEATKKKLAMEKAENRRLIFAPVKRFAERTKSVAVGTGRVVSAIGQGIKKGQAKNRKTSTSNRLERTLNENKNLFGSPKQQVNYGFSSESKPTVGFQSAKPDYSFKTKKKNNQFEL